MKRLIVLAGGLLLIAACQQQPAQEEPAVPVTEVSLSADELLERGRYLVTISGCHDCHTPKVMTPQGPALDTTRLLSGHPSEVPLPELDKNPEWVHFHMMGTAANGPWGVSFSANLTPDDTGIGNWTFDQFETAMRKGLYKGLEGNRPLLPPMPWFMYRNMTDEDLLAVFSYLKSLKPVSNLVPQPIPPQAP